MARLDHDHSTWRRGTVRLAFGQTTEGRIVSIHEVVSGRACGCVCPACEEPLTHKAVQRARKGRRLTKHMQRRVTAALNKAISLQGNEEKREWKVSELFNY